MSARTRTQRSSGTEVEVGGTSLEAGERFAGGERSEPAGRAQRSAGEPLRAAARGHELPAELVDGAVNRARVRTAVGALAGGGRLSDAVIDELLAGARSEEEIVGPGGL